MRIETLTDAAKTILGKSGKRFETKEEAVIAAAETFLKQGHGKADILILPVPKENNNNSPEESNS